MKTWMWILLAVIAVAICAYFVMDNFKVFPKSTKPKTEIIAPVAPVAKPVAPVVTPVTPDPNPALLNEVANLRVDTAQMGEKIRCLESKLPKVKKADCGCAKKVIKKPAIKKSPANKITKVTPAPTLRPVQSNNQSSNNLAYLREGGKILFCVRANGQRDLHFPDYAMQRGFTFSGSRDNKIAGYNLEVEPTDGFIGDYGVTNDGTFYFSDAIIKKALQIGGLTLEFLDIKCTNTNWDAKPMAMENGYWIYKTTHS